MENSMKFENDLIELMEEYDMITGKHLIQKLSVTCEVNEPLKYTVVYIYIPPHEEQINWKKELGE